MQENKKEKENNPEMQPPSPQRTTMPRVSIRRAYVTVGILFLINLLNYMDRFTVAGVLQKITSYFSINHSLGGLLQTIFIASYMIFAPIFGYLGDRYSRKFIMIFGLVIWSLTTFLSTLVNKHQYWLFFACRGFVGIGEASYSTVASTVIADLFVSGRRTQMLALFYFAIPVGSGLGYVVGSKVSSAFGGDRNWVWGLRVTPFLGVLLIILCFIFVVEPVRGQIEKSQGDIVADENVIIRHSYLNDVKHMLRCKTYVWSTIGFTLMCFVTGALAWWAPEFVAYSQSVYYGTDITQNDKNISLIFGGITVASGFLGVAIGAELSRRFRPRYGESDAVVCAFGLLSSIPFLFMTLILASKYIVLSYILLFFGETLLFMVWCPVADMLLAVIPPQYRATASALQILLSHLLGDAGSPYIVGLVTDRIQGSNNSNKANHRGLLYSFFMMPFITALSGACFLISSFYLVKDRAVVKASVAGHSEENRTLLNHGDYDNSSADGDNEEEIENGDVTSEVAHDDVTNDTAHDDRQNCDLEDNDVSVQCNSSGADNAEEGQNALIKV
ncbi:protein spinster homolog 3-like [Dendronephthya gigantea]|uniref:protein spinster homolog 3-like n=1 Tax=Dendronephthya gigantea TaxID=151771 RepID=UPI00106C8579|nr:protein spinster homolog 3-like [Dendronephthya gigantea]